VTEVGVEKALLTFCVRFRSKGGGDAAVKTESLQQDRQTTHTQFFLQKIQLSMQVATVSAPSTASSHVQSCCSDLYPMPVGCLCAIGPLCHGATPRFNGVVEPHSFGLMRLLYPVPFVPTVGVGAPLAGAAVIARACALGGVTPW